MLNMLFQGLKLEKLTKPSIEGMLFANCSGFLIWLLISLTGLSVLEANEWHAPCGEPWGKMVL